jgi:hypothetical protein
MGQQRTAWHVGFFRVVEQRRPSCFEVTAEFPFGTLPQRADILLVRRLDVPADDRSARVLRRLWPHVRRDGIVEYKSPAAPYARRDLVVLLGYGCQHFVTSTSRLPHRSDLLLALVVAHTTPSLTEDIAALGWRRTPSHGGYSRLVGTPFPTWIVELDSVSVAERDALVGVFGTRSDRDDDAFQWCYDNMMQLREKASPKDLVGFDEMVSRFLEALTPEQRLAGLAPDQVLPRFAPAERLAGLAPEQRLAGLAPEQRLAGLAPDQVFPWFAPEQLVLALPDDLLRALDPTALARLPDTVQQQIRKRLGR